MGQTMFTFSEGLLFELVDSPGASERPWVLFVALFSHYQ